MGTKLGQYRFTGIPLRLYRQRVYKTDAPSCPWIAECGCGSRVSFKFWDRALSCAIQHSKGDHTAPW